MSPSGSCALRSSGVRSVSETAAAMVKSPLPAYSLSPKLASGSSATYWATSQTLYDATAAGLPRPLCSRSSPDHLNCYIDFLKRALQHVEEQRLLRALNNGAPSTKRSTRK